MLKKYRYVLSRVLNALFAVIIRLYSRTFRLKLENEEAWLTYLKGGGKVLLCCWLQQFFSAIRPFKAYESFQPSLMISRSQDGEVIARIARKQGWHPVRGSSSRDGKKALKEIIERMSLSGLAAHIVDGPRGPAGIVKPGVISIARASGAGVVPLYTMADRAWFFKSWDRFMLPKPFARVTVRFGKMIHFPTQEGEVAFERQRAELEGIMREGLISAGV